MKIELQTATHSAAETPTSRSFECFSIRNGLVCALLTLLGLSTAALIIAVRDCEHSNCSLLAATSECILPQDRYYQSDRGVLSTSAINTQVYDEAKTANNSQNVHKAHFHACLTKSLVESADCVQDSYVTQEIFTVELSHGKKMFEESIHLIEMGRKLLSAHNAYVQYDNYDPSAIASVGKVCYDVISGTTCANSMCIAFLPGAHRPRKITFTRRR